MLRRASSLAVAAALSLLACSEAAPAPITKLRPEPSARRSPPVDSKAEQGEPGDPFMLSAAAHGSYDTSALVRLAGALHLPDGRGPQPSPATPLTSMFSGVVEQLFGDPGERLEAVGLRADARVRFSLRALDHRTAAVRKRLGEIVDGERPPTAQELEQLRSWAGTLGIHLRVELPTHNRERLLKVLEQVVRVRESDGDGGLRGRICPALQESQPIALCTGRSRILMWIAEPGRDDGEHLRVDMIYLFYGYDPDEAGSDGGTADLLQTLKVASNWPEQTGPVMAVPRPPESDRADIELWLEAEDTLKVL
ncbi:MAG: hypothetical protein KC457_06195, partial [Myxococcales bacterium]|nr:hypothetical protein [Myxococcales bacterium]